MSRWMVFVDGENLTIRAQEAAKNLGLDFNVQPTHYVKNVFVWVPGVTLSTGFFHGARFQIGGPPIRAYYYTSVVGDDHAVISARERLRALQFDPQVFKKDSGSAKSKGVDITLTKDVLSHASSTTTIKPYSSPVMLITFR